MREILGGLDTFNKKSVEAKSSVYIAEDSSRIMGTPVWFSTKGDICSNFKKLLWVKLITSKLGSLSLMTEIADHLPIQTKPAVVIMRNIFTSN